jgi:hypothetical protein
VLFIYYCKKDRKVVSFKEEKTAENRDFLEIALKLP